MELLQYGFFQNALWAVAILSVAAGLIGTYIVTRRLVSISGGVTHACFGGLGLGYFLGINPLLTAGVFAVGSAIGVEWLSARQRVREDSAIAVVWSIGMALGVIFVFLTPGYVPELNAFLFGNLLTVTNNDLVAYLVYTAVLLWFWAWKRRQIIICAFDRDFAAVAGLPVKFISYMMTILVAVAIVLTIRMVGIMLLMSVFSLPQMTAEVFVRRFGRIAMLSSLLTLVACVGGLMLSTLCDVPPSAIIVALLAGMFVIAKMVNAVWKR